MGNKESTGMPVTREGLRDELSSQRNHVAAALLSDTPKVALREAAEKYAQEGRYLVSMAICKALDDYAGFNLYRYASLGSVSKQNVDAAITVAGFGKACDVEKDAVSGVFDQIKDKSLAKEVMNQLEYGSNLIQNVRTEVKKIQEQRASKGDGEEVAKNVEKQKEPIKDTMPDEVETCAKELEKEAPTTPKETSKPVLDLAATVLNPKSFEGEHVRHAIADVASKIAEAQASVGNYMPAAVYSLIAGGDTRTYYLAIRGKLASEAVREDGDPLKFKREQEELCRKDIQICEGLRDTMKGPEDTAVANFAKLALDSIEIQQFLLDRMPAWITRKKTEEGEESK